MIRTIFFSCMILLFILVAGCSAESNKVATISVNSDSDYMNVYHKLNLGKIYDFDLELNHADKRWVRLWVEQYNIGETEPQQLKELYYGNFPQEVVEGNIGFGMVGADDLDGFLLFLYGLDMSIGTSLVERDHSSNFTSYTVTTYGMDNIDIDLELNETMTIAAYVETENSADSSMGIHDEETVNKLIEEGNMVLLLKIRIED